MMRREAGGGLNPVDDSRLRKPHDSSAPEAEVELQWNPLEGRLEEEEQLVEVSGPHNTDCRAGRTS